MKISKSKKCLVGFVLLVASAISNTVHGQGVSNLWVMGYQNTVGMPFGGMIADFDSGVPIVQAHDRPMNFFATVADISDDQGTLLLYTNGIYIADRTDAPMPEGQGLNPSFYTAGQDVYGLNLNQANGVLPSSADDAHYFLIHFTADTLRPSDGQLVTVRVYRTTMDMALNQGYGEVVEKNEVILADTLEWSGMSCVRHANGRDWWVMVHRYDSSTLTSILITPDSARGPYHQEAGVQRMGWGWNGNFSADGRRYVSIDGVHGMDLFDFDRCSGELYNARHVPVTSGNTASSAVFSPSGDRLYMTAYDRVYQYDCMAADLAGSQTTVAVWDSTYDTYPVFQTMFWITRLAPDGKIYITTGNGTHYLHVINAPDELGLACDLQQHALELPQWNANSIPYHPNYWLGPVDGTVCDSLGINSGLSIRGAAEEAVGVRAYPNPSNGTMMLTYATQPGAGALEVLDAKGRVVRREALPPWSSLHRVEMEDVPEGLYLCTLQWGPVRSTARIAIMH